MLYICYFIMLHCQVKEKWLLLAAFKGANITFPMAEYWYTSGFLFVIIVWGVY